MFRTRKESGIVLEQVNHRVYTFLKENGRWYIDLPEYLQQGGHKADLEMVAGADEMLTVMARGKKKVTIEMDREPFEGADLLELAELCDAPMGGGYYIMHTYKGRPLNKRMWLCDVTLFVFGDMPQKIFCKKLEAPAGSKEFVRMNAA
jgi:hypothetical protein